MHLTKLVFYLPLQAAVDRRDYLGAYSLVISTAPNEKLVFGSDGERCFLSLSWAMA